MLLNDIGNYCNVLIQLKYSIFRRRHTEIRSLLMKTLTIGVELLQYIILINNVSSFTVVNYEVIRDT